MARKEDMIQLFTDIATAISARHLATVKMLTMQKGERLPYDELMPVLQQMQEELTQKGVEFIGIVKKTDNRFAETLSDDLGIVIRSTVEGFIKQL